MDDMDAVEDTKGNNGERGSLVVTNLRLIWLHTRTPRINLSIGYKCILNIAIRKVDSRQLGTTHALYVLTKFSDSRFEFIFTHLVRGSPRLFTTVQAVHRSYESSLLFRELKLRGAIIRDGGRLNLLPGEHVYDQIPGVWNLASDQGNLGAFVVTDVRVVWFAQLAPNFNVSVPYMQIRSVARLASKFGDALVISTTSSSGGFVLGFRIDPAERLAEVLKEITALHKVHSATPNFGVVLKHDDAPTPLGERTVHRRLDTLEIVDAAGGSAAAADPVALYEAGRGGDRGREGEVVFSEALGLAVERPREGATVESLWRVALPDLGTAE
jgi:Bardet-Biedl syndrome 5 protein